MSSHLGFIRICTGIDTSPILLRAAVNECDRLNIDTVAPLKAS